MKAPKQNRRIRLKTDLFSAKLFDAIQFAWENDIWPSSRNLATLMGYERPKLNGRMNKERIKILRGHFYL